MWPQRKTGPPFRPCRRRRRNHRTVEWFPSKWLASCRDSVRLVGAAMRATPGKAHGRRTSEDPEYCARPIGHYVQPLRGRGGLSSEQVSQATPIQTDIVGGNQVRVKSPISRPRRVRGLMSSEELAVLFAVTSETVRRWTREGRLHPLRTPKGRVRYRRAEVMPLLKIKGGSPSQARMGATD